MFCQLLGTLFTVWVFQTFVNKESFIAIGLRLVNYEKELIVNSSDNQSFEISKMGWFSKEEALNKLRDYHKSRIKIINTMFNFLENIEDYIII